MLKPVITFATQAPRRTCRWGRHPSWPRNWAEPPGSPFCANSRGTVGVSQERLLAQLEERVVGAGGPWASERLLFEGVAGAPLTYI